MPARGAAGRALLALAVQGAVLAGAAAVHGAELPGEVERIGVSDGRSDRGDVARRGDQQLAESLATRWLAFFALCARMRNRPLCDAQ